MGRTIYLDNAATTRVADDIADLVRDCMVEHFGNPASAHHLGIAAEKRVKTARAELSKAVGDSGEQAGQLLFTSGGTEADAMGVMGPARAKKSRGLHKIVLSAVEHPAVRESAKRLVDEGFEVTLVPVTQAGVADTQAVVDAVDDKTAVVAVMLVQNEIGTVMPVADIARAVHEKNPLVHVHTDAVQGLGKIPLDVVALGVDSAAFAAHKIHGPKGVGALWLKKNAAFRPLWCGGGQQQGLRSGTLNVPGIAALGRAAALATEDLAQRTANFLGFAEHLRGAIAKMGVEFVENGASAPRSPHVVSFAFRGVPAEPLLHVLESRGVLVSAGSACSERDRKPSAVLSAIGLGKEYGTVRLSFGRDTTLADIEEAADVLGGAIASFQ